MNHKNPTLTVTFALVACSAILSSSCSKPPPRAEAPPPRVSVQQASAKELIDHDDFNGWLDSSATVEVRARVRAGAYALSRGIGYYQAQRELEFVRPAHSRFHKPQSGRKSPCKKHSA